MQKAVRLLQQEDKKLVEIAQFDVQEIIPSATPGEYTESYDTLRPS